MIMNSALLYKCSMRTNIYPLEPKLVDGQVELAAEIESPNGERKLLWYRVPEELAQNLTASAEPYLIAAIFAAMTTKANVHVHGTVSPFLIRNLMEFQAYWYANLPGKYSRVEITAETEAETDVFPDLDRSICAFSGGVDSSFTVYRHASGTCGRLKRNLGAALFVHGFDIPLEDEDAYKRAFRTNQDTLKTVGVPLYPIQSNHRLLFPDWNETHAAGIASCLTFFKRTFSEGIIPGTYCYSDLAPLWGSNPTSDHLMSSRNFSIYHDGAILNRGYKMYHLREWRIAYERIRVCYSNPKKDQNCGLCGKCLVTLTLISMLKLPTPCSFPHALSEDVFQDIEQLDEVYIESFETLLKLGKKLPFRKQFSHLIATNRQRIRSKNPIHNGLKQTSERIKALFRKPPY